MGKGNESWTGVNRNKVEEEQKGERRCIKLKKGGELKRAKKKGLRAEEGRCTRKGKLAFFSFFFFLPFFCHSAENARLWASIIPSDTKLLFIILNLDYSAENSLSRHFFASLFFPFCYMSPSYHLFPSHSR